LKKQELDAIAAIAGHFSATWEASGGVWLTVAGKRIAVEIVAIQQRIADGAKPRLRLDKVARGLVHQLQTSLNDVVPDGRTVIVTITAPIRQDAKTTVALEQIIRAALQGRSARTDLKEVIHGNQIRVRIVRTGCAKAQKLVGFVHNPDPGADDVLLDSTEALMACMHMAPDGRVPAKFSGARWLVITNESKFSHIEVWRKVLAQLSAPAGFSKVLMVFAGGVVEVLSS